MRQLSNNSDDLKCFDDANTSNISISNTSKKSKKTKKTKRERDDSSSSNVPVAAKKKKKTEETKGKTAAVKKRKREAKTAGNSNTKEFVLPKGWKCVTLGPYGDGRFHSTWYSPDGKKFRSIIGIRRYLGEDIPIRNRSSVRSSSY